MLLTAKQAVMLNESHQLKGLGYSYKHSSGKLKLFATADADFCSITGYWQATSRFKHSF
jgi:hypothetical protein